MTDTTTLLKSVSENLGITASWVKKGDALWLEPGQKSVREVAQVMNEVHARFVTITAYQLLGDQGFCLEYHWDLDGQLLGFAFRLASNSVESIFDLCEAADWIEREIHEGFGLNFTGREYEPLQLRKGDTPGVNLREVKP
jgi:NADH:ubiquinone oxidoreductase subunit C